MGNSVGNNFDDKQLLAIDCLAEGMNCTETAEKVGVSLSTVSRWRTNPSFLQAVVDKAREVLKGYLPEIYQAAARNAITGSAQHIKIILDHIDNLEKKVIDSSAKQIVFTWDLNESK